MSTCRSLVVSFIDSFMTRPIICWLSHRIDGSWPGFRLIDRKKRFHQAVSFDVYVRTSSSASVLEVVTIFCLIEYQSIGLPNNLKRYPSVLCLMIKSSAKAASLMQTKACWLFVWAEYSIASFF